MGENYIEVAAAVIVDAGGRFLAARRTGGYLDGLWEFPGGKIQDGESSLEATEREILEELGVRIIARERVLTSQHSYPDKRVRLHFMLSELVNGERSKLKELEEKNMLDWFTPSTAPLDDFCAADREAFQSIPWNLILKNNGEE